MQQISSEFEGILSDDSFEYGDGSHEYKMDSVSGDISIRKYNSDSVLA